MKTNFSFRAIAATVLLWAVSAAAFAQTVTITAPSDGATYTLGSAVNITATKSGGGTKIRFLQNSTEIGIDNSSPFSYSFTPATAGTYVLEAELLTPADAVIATSSPVTITVTSPNNAPSVSLTSPSNGATGTAPASFTLSATASDSDGTIASVKFYEGANLLNTDSSSPYSFNWTSVSAGSYAITAVATDDDGATTTSSVANVTVSSGSGNSVTLTAPANGASYTLGNTINLTATKVGATITKVRFKQNGTVISTDTSSPYAASFTPGTTGSYALVAEGLNSSNTVLATSATVNVSVNPVGGGSVTATRSYVYDQHERLCKVIEPERGATVIDYDAAGNIAWTAEGTALTTATCDRENVLANQKVTRTYDAMNRVTAVSTPGGTADVTTTYYADGAVNTLTAANLGGNNVTTTYTYNKRRLLTGETVSIAGPQGHAPLSLGYAYDANGFLSVLTYPDLETVNFAPDALGRATQVITGGGTTYANGITYFAGGAIAQFNYGNGITHTMGKNARQLPTTSRDWYCTPGPNIEACANKTYVLNDTYAFDEHGNVDHVTDALPASATNRSRDLGYDALDRLIVADAEHQWDTATFSYDALDNIRSADVGTRQYRYTYDAITNRLTEIKNPAGVQQFAFSYDSRGNTTAKGSQAYVFDYGNRLNQVTGSQTYAYDGQGRRVLTLDADGKKTYWIYSQSGQVLYTEEARRRQNMNYVYLGNSQVATRAWNWDTLQSTIRYQHTDSLGSIVAQTDVDRQVVVRNSYEPYGGAWNSTIDGTGYTGHVMDQATGLTYMQQRYYDPQVGRFLSVDPVAVRAGGDNFNRYWYASSNPYKFVDPDGRDPAPGCGDGKCNTWIADHPNVREFSNGFRQGAGVSSADDIDDSQNFGSMARQAGFHAGAEMVRQADRDPATGAPSHRSPSKKSDSSDSTANLTPREARREVMRQQGVPTSQQPVSQSSPRGPGNLPAGRQLIYETPNGTVVVQHQLQDKGHGPHWEAGSAKPGGQTDPAGRPRLTNDKAKVEE